MKRSMLKSKIHRATVTDADLEYEGSISIDPALCGAADLVEFEKVDVYNCDNGNRFHTYVIWAGAGEININSASINSPIHTWGVIEVDDWDMTDQSELLIEIASGPQSDHASALPDALRDALLDFSQRLVVWRDPEEELAQAGVMNWDFSVDTALLQHLAEGEQVEVTYRVTAKDDSGFTSASGFNEIDRSHQDITITITGSNDQPVIHVDAGDSDTATITEFNAPLTTSGTLSAIDPDDINTLVAIVDEVVIDQNNTSLSGVNPLTLDQYKEMFSVTDTFIEANAGDSNNLSWEFNTGGQNLDFLAEGDVLTLQYTVVVGDDSAAAQCSCSMFV